VLKNKNGLTLIEILVASAIMVIISLAFSKMMFHQLNQQKSANAKTTFNGLVNSIQGAANNPRILKNSADAVGPPSPSGPGGPGGPGSQQ
jgi:prepilin-type N-terminal cleavage/methylation domain-containing protein